MEESNKKENTMDEVDIYVRYDQNNKKTNNFHNNKQKHI